MQLVADFAENLATNQTPEWWLALHGWTNDFDTAAMDDADSDGMATWAEFRADTVPTNGNSVLAILGICRTNGVLRVEWKGGIEARQLLESVGDLVATTEQWVAVFSNNPPTPVSTNHLLGDVTNRVRFYRLKAWRP